MCVNERKGRRTVRLQGVEMEKAHEYLGSNFKSNGECGKGGSTDIRQGWVGGKKCQD